MRFESIEIQQRNRRRHYKYKTSRRAPGRGSFRGSSRGRGQSNGRGIGRLDGSGQYMTNIQFYNCGNYGQMNANSWSKDSQMIFIKEEADDEVIEEPDDKLFMTHTSSGEVWHGHLWFINSGCSNHITGLKSIFSDFDEMQKQTVQLGDGKDLQVERRGIVRIQVNLGKFKFLNNVQYVPALRYNLISMWI